MTSSGQDQAQPADVEAAADRLYALPPDQFTRARDELATAARDADDRGLAAQIKALRRPTLAAWAVNLLARDGGAALETLLELGEQLRAAQADLAGDRIKELSGRRPALTRKVLDRARQLTAEHDERVTPQAADEIEATMQAALADQQAARAVASGRLTRALSYAGLGEVDITAATATPLTARPEPAKRGKPARSPQKDEKKRGKEPAPAPDRGADQRRQAQAEADDAAQQAERSRRLVDEARQRERAALERLEHLQQELQAAREEATQATRSAAGAQRQHDRDDRAAAAARRRLDRLPPP